MLPIGSSLGGVRKPDFDDSVGVEVGGPLIKDKLFFWVGFAPRITDTHVLRTTYAQTEDPNNPGSPILNASGQPVGHADPLDRPHPGDAPDVLLRRDDRLDCRCPTTT